MTSSFSGITSRPVQWRLIFWPILFYVLFLAYLPCLRGPFLYDGVQSILLNEDFRSDSPFTAILGNHEDSLSFDRRPVGALLTYFNFKIFGTNPYAFHITNLLLHWLVAIAIGETMLLVARRLASSSTADWIIGATVLLWALHPLNTMPVAYIYQRMEILMSLFYVLAIYSLLRSSGDDAKTKVKWLVLAGFSAILSILSKESGISVIGALFAVEWLILKKSGREILQKNSAFYGLLTLGIGGIIYWHSSGPRMADLVAGSELASPWGYFKAQCSVIVDYLRLIIWPNELSFLYMPIHTMSWTHWVPHLAGLLGLGAVIAYFGRTRIWMLLCGLLFVMILSPTSSFVPIAVEPKVEYRVYLASALVLLILVAATWNVVLKLVEKPRQASLSFGFLVAGVLMVSFFKTRERVAIYSNTTALWEDTSIKQPRHFKAWYNLGINYLSNGMTEKSKRCAYHLAGLEKINNDPNCGYLGYQLNGLALLQEKQFGESAASFQKALGINPNHPETRAQMAYSLARQGMIKEASRQLSHKDLAQVQSPLTLATASLVVTAEHGEQAGLELLQKFEAQFPQHPLLLEMKNHVTKAKKNSQ